MRSYLIISLRTLTDLHLKLYSTKDFKNDCVIIISFCTSSIHWMGIHVCVYLRIVIKYFWKLRTITHLTWNSKKHTKNFSSIIISKIWHQPCEHIFILVLHIRLITLFIINFMNYYNQFLLWHPSLRWLPLTLLSNYLRLFMRILSIIHLWL